MFHIYGNKPIKSTQATATDPSTATLIAEIDSTQFAQVSPREVLYRVFWRVGASTGAIYRLEHCSSTGLGSTAILDVQTVFTGSNQTSQFVSGYMINPGDRLRVRVGSSFTAAAAASIEAEPML